MVVVCMLSFCCCSFIRCSFLHLLCYFQIQLPWLMSLSKRVHDDVLSGGSGELRGKVQRDGVVRLGLAKGRDDDVGFRCCLWRWRRWGY